MKNDHLKVEYMEIGKLKEWEENPRINEEAAEKLAELIEAHGFINPVIVTPDLKVRAGHTRIKAAQKIGIKKVPVMIVDFETESQAEAYSLADNKSGEWAEWDFKKLVDILFKLDVGDFNMDTTGFKFDEIEDLMTKYGERPIDEEEDFNVEEELGKIKEAVTQRGDLWILGKHQLLCGDATEITDIKNLVKKKEISLIITDPPYNVNYISTKDQKIMNDNMNDFNFYQFLLATFKNLENIIDKGVPFYIFHADSEGLIFRRALVDAGLKLRQVIVWVKNSLVLGHSDYHWQHEPIIYGWKDGAAHPWFGFRDKTTVWEEVKVEIDDMKKPELKEYIKDLISQINSSVIRIDKPSRNEEHPTMKPLPLIRLLMQNSSRGRKNILDPFMGSGSTMIAAEQLDRNAFGLELDPQYVDVSVKRYIKFREGKTLDVKLIRDGHEINLSEVLKKWESMEDAK